MTVTPVYQLNESTLQRIASTLEAPSSVVMRMVSLLQLLDPEHGEIERCINEDPLLAIEVIRAANTADGGGRLKVDSISEAISVLGYERLARTAMMYSFSKLAPKRLSAYGLNSEAFYRKSQICAMTMDYLSVKGMSSGGHYYTIGLLHAIGELVIDRFLVERGVEYDVFAGVCLRPLSLLESELTGIDQAKVAGKVLRSWKFPDSIVRPIEGQFDLAVESEYADRATALATARYITELIIEEESGGAPSTEKTAHMVYKGKSLCRLVDFVKGELGLTREMAS